MTYSFDTEIAEQFGLNEAIMLHNLVFWLKTNKANETNYFDGKFWTYNSHKAFKELFPFWSESQIKRTLQSLNEQGVIVKGNYNSNPYDKTNWYALSDEFSYLIGHNSLIDETNLANRENEIVSSIHTDIKPVKKPYKKQQIKNEELYFQDLPSCIGSDIWLDWIKYRKTRKLSCIPQTLNAQMKQLAEWHSKGHNPNEIIKASITAGWQGLFEPKGAFKQKQDTVTDRNNLNGYKLDNENGEVDF